MKNRGDWIERLIRSFSGIVFIYSAVSKFGDVEHFLGAINKYEILPDALITPFAYGVIVLEAVVGTMLLLGFERRVFSALAILMYLLFIAALSQAVIRRLAMDCGCFSESRGSFLDRPSGAIARDILLMSGPAWIFLRGLREPVPPV